MLDDVLNKVNLKLDGFQSILDNWNIADLKKTLGNKCAKINQLITTIAWHEGLNEDQKEINAVNSLRLVDLRTRFLLQLTNSYRQVQANLGKPSHFTKEELVDLVDKIDAIAEEYIQKESEAPREIHDILQTSDTLKRRIQENYVAANSLNIIELPKEEIEEEKYVEAAIELAKNLSLSMMSRSNEADEKKNEEIDIDELAEALHISMQTPSISPAIPNNSVVSNVADEKKEEEEEEEEYVEAAIELAKNLSLSMMSDSNVANEKKEEEMDIDDLAEALRISMQAPSIPPAILNRSVVSNEADEKKEEEEEDEEFDLVRALSFSLTSPAVPAKSNVIHDLAQLDTIQINEIFPMPSSELKTLVLIRNEDHLSPNAKTQYVMGQIEGESSVRENGQPVTYYRVTLLPSFQREGEIEGHQIRISADKTYRFQGNVNVNFGNFLRVDENDSFDLYLKDACEAFNAFQPLSDDFAELKANVSKREVVIDTYMQDIHALVTQLEFKRQAWMNGSLKDQPYSFHSAVFGTQFTGSINEINDSFIQPFLQKAEERVNCLADLLSRRNQLPRG